ncbi:TerD family protein [Streptomyces huiliensis]|uniref:TerD family protein n=1 Tax=Streptomyces huiliensis TaxID=2876027 RepID=UPI0027E19A72|nr:TerD family protein [Streptomyces huiliensis]MBZ4323081.1 TerD family protein [Streptomyces huiliensis]
MGVPLTKGGNVSLSGQAPGLTAVTVGLGWQVAPGCDLDASALLCDRSGRVLSDGHFVFFNNLTSPDGSVRHGGDAGGEGDAQRIHIELGRVPAEVTKIVFPVSLYEAEARGQDFRQVRGAHIRVTDRDGGAELARYALGAGDAGDETAMVFGELYRHGAEWKFRAVGQGYASGLAGIAADYGVDVLRDAAPVSVEPPAASPGIRKAAEDAPAPAPAPAAAPAVPASTSTPTPTPTVVVPSAAPAHSAPTLAAVPQHPAHPTQPTHPTHPVGSPSMTCFFDPSHGPGMTTVSWSPQWGVPRPVQACGGCAHRVQTTPPPYYTAPQAGYPQAGYPQPVQQQGYPQAPQQGYPAAQPAPHAEPQQGGGQQGGRRFGTGALIGAGAAGLVGGALLNEAFDDDEPDVVVNNYYED